MGDRDWLSGYESASNKADEAQASVNDHERIQRGGQAGVQQAASKVRKTLTELSSKIAQLEEELTAASKQYLITDAELSRRQNLISTLKGRKTDLQSKFNRGPDRSADLDSRNMLMGDGRGGPRQMRIEDDRTVGLDGHGLLNSQAQIMRDQDKGLDILQQSIQRQKQIGLQIGGEVEEQNEMLDTLSSGLDKTGRRLNAETHHTARVAEKSKAGGMMCCIALLILAIILVGAIPFG